MIDGGTLCITTCYLYLYLGWVTKKNNKTIQYKSMLESIKFRHSTKAEEDN